MLLVSRTKPKSPASCVAGLNKYKRRLEETSDMRYSISLAVFAVATLLSLPGTARAAVRGGPPGTYLETCRDVRIDGDRLWARCEKADGNWRDTSLDDVYRCVRDIANGHGRLSCQKAAGPPQCDDARTCRDIRMRFNSLYARCP